MANRAHHGHQPALVKRERESPPIVLSHSPLRIFGAQNAGQAFTFNLQMPPHSSSSAAWDASQAYASPTAAHSSFNYAQTMQDDYDDGDDLGDLVSVTGPAGESGMSAAERVVRRRSSKACDQCRKSKCKCERTMPGEPCKACVMLGTPCTSLGPSRKRGPPKGYIDAIEARLHQAEALVGILLAVNDVRAKSLLDDLADDPLANEIIRRVDASAYGVKGRARANDGGKPEAKTKAMLEQDNDMPTGHPSHPSNEWQDIMSAKLNALAKSRGQTVTDGDFEGPRGRRVAALPTIAPSTRSADSEAPRRRRRIGSRSSSQSPPRDDTASSLVTEDSSEEDAALVAEVGQLSLNEESELRFHGKASGLHLLGVKDRMDGRNDGGIWRFPKSGVWPPLPSGHTHEEHSEEALPIALPNIQSQEALLELYFTYVHPSLPVLHKQAFLEDFRTGNIGTPPAVASPIASGSSPGSMGGVGKRRTFVSRLLLLVIFSIGSRFQSHHASTAANHAPGEGALWPAGGEYFEAAKTLLARGGTYASPRVSSCQALLLMAYREIGIGAMAHAWLYLGMGIRMAHDLGLHKAAERWSHEGELLFTPAELEERRRIWSACVVMDKYVSAYIGRPVYIHERDYDTEPPSANEHEEMEEWRSKPSTVLVFDPDDDGAHEGPPVPVVTVPGRALSCFAAAQTLANIGGRVIHQVYSIRAGPGRYAESLRIEEALDKWYMDLPVHLQVDATATATASSIPPPHFLALHVGYWCTVILLHRPFIRHMSDGRPISGKNDEKDHEGSPKAISQRSYDLCVRAANHITSLITGWRTHYCIRRAPVFLCYYVFTAAITHVNTLTAYPDDPQAQRGLITCMDVLKKLDTVWPAAGRAWELLRGSKPGVILHGLAGSASTLPVPSSNLPAHAQRKQRLSVKRSAETFMAEDPELTYSPSNVTDPRVQQNIAYGNPLPSQTHTSPPIPSISSSDPTYFSIAELSATGPSSYDRWADQTVAGASAGGFTNGLSTSGLPPQYSTGFPAAETRVPTRAVPQRSASGRYPQYWGEYPAVDVLNPVWPNAPPAVPPRTESRNYLPGYDYNREAPPPGMVWVPGGMAPPPDFYGSSRAR